VRASWRQVLAFVAQSDFSILNASPAFGLYRVDEVAQLECTIPLFLLELESIVPSIFLVLRIDVPLFCRENLGVMARVLVPLAVAMVREGQV